MARHIFILAGGHKQAANFARDNGLWPQHWTYLHNERQLCGLYEPHYIKIGDWLLLKNIERIEEMLHERKAIECKSVTVLN